MAFKIIFSEDAERDLHSVFEFLFESYVGFGEDAASAIERAIARVQSIRQDARSIAEAPYRGTRHEDLLPGLRHVTIGKAVFWFRVLETPETVRILAVFFGGQDHQRRMLTRLLGDKPSRG